MMSMVTFAAFGGWTLLCVLLGYVMGADSNSGGDEDDDVGAMGPDEVDDEFGDQ